jgi:DNA topoisomerase-1
MKGEVPTHITCEKCGRPMAIKSGRNGLFLACTGYPECKNTSDFRRDEKGRIHLLSQPEVAEDEPPCERCGRPMVAKSGKFGPFLACTGYPECTHTRPIISEDDPLLKAQPTDMKCPECGGRMVLKVSRTGQRFFACSNYPKCSHTQALSTGVPCPEKGCGGTLVERTSKKGRRFFACNRYPDCRFAMWDEPVDEVCPECGTPVLALKTRKGSSPKLVCRKKGCGFSKPAPNA